MSVFPDEIYAAPETWTERAYPKLIYFHKAEKGGHFAAWEQPAQFTRGPSRGVPLPAQGLGDAWTPTFGLAMPP